MNLRCMPEVIKKTFASFVEDRAPRMGAALAFYSAFSITPLVILVIAAASFFFREGGAQKAIVDEIRETLGTDVGDAIDSMIRNAQESGSTTLATVLGVAVLLFGASGVFGELQDSLNTIWKVKPKPNRGWLGILRDRFFSFTMVLGTGFLLLVSLVISAALAGLGKFLSSGALPGGVFLWQVVNAVVSFGFITLVFALIYKFVPDVKIAWKDVWPGALVTAALFTLGKQLLGLYLGWSGTASAYGAAGSLAVLLLWVYYSAQILLLGVEFTREYAQRCGSRVVAADNAVPATAEDRTHMPMPQRAGAEAAHSP
jgi:membrane protein